MKNKLKIVAFFLITSTVAFSQGDQTKENIAIIKENFENSQASIKKYSWIETTTVFLNGEQKSVEQNQCYYDVSGTLVKLPTAATTQAKMPRGIRGRIVENKKEEIEGYIAKAKTQIKAYIPPQSEKLDQLYSSGNVAVKVLAPNKEYELDFSNYLVTGDLVAIKLNVINKVLTGFNVNTYIDAPTDTISLNVTFQNLPDGTSYAGNVTFNSASKNLKIVTVNSGYRVGTGQ